MDKENPRTEVVMPSRFDGEDKRRRCCPGNGPHANWPTALKLNILTALIAIAHLVPFSAFSQSVLKGSRDQRAVALLTQSVSSGGAEQVHRAAEGYTASGTITYFWGGKEVSGPVKIKSRGTDQFYLEANLPNGTRLFSVSHGGGVLVDANGRKTEIPYHNAIKAAVPIIPQTVIAAELPESASTIGYVGIAEISAHQAHQIEIHPLKAQPRGAKELVSKLLEKQVFVDPQTHHILRISDKTHPIEGFGREIDRQYEFENYAVFEGMEVPTLVRETIAGAKVSEIHITSITITNRLGDADFPVR